MTEQPRQMPLPEPNAEEHIGNNVYKAHGIQHERLNPVALPLEDNDDPSERDTEPVIPVEENSTTKDTQESKAVVPDWNTIQEDKEDRDALYRR